MGVDFSTRSLVGTQSAIIDDGCLIVLDREGSRDRVWRIQFDRVQSFFVWRTMPWITAVISGLILALSIVLLVIPNPVSRWIGVLLFVGIAPIEAWLLYCRNTNLGFVRDGVAMKLTFMVRPAKRERIVRRIRENIAATQARLALSQEQMALTTAATNEQASDSAIPDGTLTDQPAEGQNPPDGGTSEQSIT
jgi:hypothetical protein